MENNKKKSIIPTIILTILSLLWIYPIILILLNSLKRNQPLQLQEYLNFLWVKYGMDLQTM